MCLEVQTGLLFDMLMSKTSGRAVQRRVDHRLVSEVELAEHVRQETDPWRSGPLGTVPGTLQHDAASAAMRSLSNPGRAVMPLVIHATAPLSKVQAPAATIQFREAS
jgi:hypothetical protein